MTESKPGLPGFAEHLVRHRTTPIRYFTAGSGPPLVLVHGAFS